MDLADQTWQRTRDALEGYVAPLLDFTVTSYGRNAIHEAWLEFTLGASTEFTAGHPETELFFPWFFHRWAPDAAKGNTVDFTVRGISPTRAYLARKGRQLDSYLRDYLEACLTAPFGFHEILACEPNVAFIAKDVFTDTELRVRDRSASSTLMKGDIFFGQVVQLRGIAMLEGIAPFAFPPAFMTHLLRVKHRKEPRIDTDLAFRGIYFSLAKAYLNPEPPKILNTDGDVMEPRTLYFDIASPQSAFDALKPLALGISAEELREDATFDADGVLVEATIPWLRKASKNHAAMETVLIARLQITGRKLTAKVNSLERARAVRSRVEEALGGSARYRRTRKQPLETMMPPTTTFAPGLGPQFVPRDAEQEALMQQPEVRAQIEAFQRRHYESWPEIPLPALQGRTPLEAVKSADGRAMVSALIAQFERDSAQHDLSVGAEVFAGLRRRLGL